MRLALLLTLIFWTIAIIMIPLVWLVSITAILVALVCLIFVLPIFEVGIEDEA